MLKRTADDQYSGMNFTGNNNTRMDSSTADAKKARIEACGPSRVLHIRSVPEDVTEAEIIQLGLPFGRITNIHIARKKYQAFLEMADLQTSQTMYNCYSERQPQVRGRTVYVQYSNYQQLKSHGQDHGDDGTSPTTPRSYSGMQQAFGNSSISGPGHGFSAGRSSGSGNVIRVMIDNMIYPVTVQVLHKVFSKCGQVDKIVTFTKNDTFQALVQFPDSATGLSAIQTMNGQNIYNQCCTMSIDVSNLSSLKVLYNNEKSWDYTNPNLPSDPSGYQQGAPNVPANDGILGAFGEDEICSSITGFSGLGSAAGAANVRGTANGNAIGRFNSPSGLGIGALSGMNGLGMTMQGMGGFGRGMGNMAGGLGMGGMMGLMGAGMNAMGLGMNAMGAGMRPLGAAIMTQGMMGGGGSGCVVLVSNLCAERITPDAIHTLFGFYGCVTRVKILFNKKDTALVQYTDAAQAANAIQQLDRVTWWGKSMKVTLSKNNEIVLHKAGGQDEGATTKDFTDSPFNRYKNLSSKPLNVNYPPSATLHLANIPSNSTEDELRDLFQQHGTVVAFQFFEKDKRMALIQLGSAEEAVAALVALHNHVIGGTSLLRVSFTKSYISSRQ